jgi:hypothetical protein
MCSASKCCFPLALLASSGPSCLTRVLGCVHEAAWKSVAMTVMNLELIWDCWCRIAVEKQGHQLQRVTITPAVGSRSRTESELLSSWQRLVTLAHPQVIRLKRAPRDSATRATRALAGHGPELGDSGLQVSRVVTQPAGRVPPLRTVLQECASEPAGPGPQARRWLRLGS